MRRKSCEDSGAQSKPDLGIGSTYSVSAGHEVGIALDVLLVQQLCEVDSDAMQAQKVSV